MPQVLHRDVKSGNVLLSKDYGVAKICDIGLSHIMGNTSLSPPTAQSTFAYAAPEMLLNFRWGLRHSNFLCLLLHVTHGMCCTQHKSLIQSLDMFAALSVLCSSFSSTADMSFNDDMPGPPLAAEVLATAVTGIDLCVKLSNCIVAILLSSFDYAGHDVLSCILS